jgi:hypothetical protein
MPTRTIWIRWGHNLSAVAPPDPNLLQDLRGGRLDHEHHDMSEHRETATADRYQASHIWRGISPHSTTLRAGSGRAEETCLVHKKIHNVNFFVNKIKSTMLPQANRAITVRKRPVCRPTA